jgi:hypothetical protein
VFRSPDSGEGGGFTWYFELTRGRYVTAAGSLLLRVRMGS